jgi:hypothetical protein
MCRKGDVAAQVLTESALNSMKTKAVAGCGGSLQFGIRKEENEK